MNEKTLHYIAIKLCNLFNNPCEHLDGEMTGKCDKECPEYSYKDNIECWERVLNKWINEHKEY